MTPRGRITQGNKTVYFEKLPPVLSIQLKRVRFENNTISKNNACVVFGAELTMDRYAARGEHLPLALLFFRDCDDNFCRAPAVTERVPMPFWHLHYFVIKILAPALRRT